jgi:tetratricopeptide (TPR) repeat protein
MKYLALAIVLAVASRAYADPPAMSPEARTHLQRGIAYGDTNDYAAAIAELKAGQKIEAHPIFLYALGQTYRKQGDCAHAVESYLAFLATRPDNDLANAARKHIAECPAGRPAEPAVTPPAPAPPPPPHAAQPAEREPDRVPEAHFYADVPGDVLAAGGALGLGLGITYFVLGDRDARGANVATTLARRQAFAARSDRERTIGTISTIAGGALVVGAVVRYVMVAGRKSEPAVSVTVTPSAVMAGWSRSW